MLIAVYTIAKNEEKFAKRWASTTEAADIRLVVDTGSTDATVSSLTAEGVAVMSITVQPFRYEDARNAALALLPEADVVIALDMDETLTEGWRSQIESAWTSETTRLSYRYVWSFLHGRPDVVFYTDKITGRHTHRWKNPVHEVLVPTVPETINRCDAILIEHHPDSTKPRSQYLGLLELAVSEAPDDDRSLHYLAREYFFHAAYPEAIQRFQQHLSLPRATWKPERAASMRYLGKCYTALEDWPTATAWFVAAISEDASRDSLIDAARCLLAQKQFSAMIEYCTRALKAPPAAHYLTDRYAQIEGAHDLLAIAYYYLNEFASAIPHAEQAVILNPDDPRLQENLVLIRGRLTG